MQIRKGISGFNPTNVTINLQTMKKRCETRSSTIPGGWLVFEQASYVRFGPGTSKVNV